MRRLTDDKSESKQLTVRLPAAVEEYEEPVDGRRHRRSEKFKQQYVQMARSLCRFGATDAELAFEFKVSLPTIYSWRSKFPKFSEACKLGKEHFDDRVEASLAMQAVGYFYQEREARVVNKEIVWITVTRFKHPEFLPTAMWLKNRRPQQWRERTELEARINATYEIKQPIQELMRRVDSLSARSEKAKVIEHDERAGGD